MKYVIEISDEDLEYGCDGCPLNNGWEFCAAFRGDHADDPMIAWGREDEEWDIYGDLLKERTKGCPLVPLSHYTGEMSE